MVIMIIHRTISRYCWPIGIPYLYYDNLDINVKRGNDRTQFVMYRSPVSIISYIVRSRKHCKFYEAVAKTKRSTYRPIMLKI